MPQLRRETDMFCVIYEFEVDPKLEADFQNAWHQLTLEIRSKRCGLGSRLHKVSGRNNIWLAYAQWPDRDTWLNPGVHDPDMNKWRDVLKNSTEEIRTVYELEVMDDLLI